MTITRRISRSMLPAISRSITSVCTPPSPSPRSTITRTFGTVTVIGAISASGASAGIEPASIGQSQDSRRSAATCSDCRLPSRSTTRSTFCPGSSRPIRSRACTTLPSANSASPGVRALPSAGCAIALPPTDTSLSPARMPAFSAGPPGVTAAMNTPSSRWSSTTPTIARFGSERYVNDSVLPSSSPVRRCSSPMRRVSARSSLRASRSSARASRIAAVISSVTSVPAAWAGIAIAIASVSISRCMRIVRSFRPVVAFNRPPSSRARSRMRRPAARLPPGPVA